jgi:hypothetical protein
VRPIAHARRRLGGRPAGLVQACRDHVNIAPGRANLREALKHRMGICDPVTFAVGIAFAACLNPIGERLEARPPQSALQGAQPRRALTHEVAIGDRQHPGGDASHFGDHDLRSWDVM